MPSKLVNRIAEKMGIKTSDANIKDTPSRVERLFDEMVWPKEQIEENVTIHLSRAFPSRYKGIILEPSIEAESICPHHLIPVEYLISLAYIPNLEQPIVLGASKLIRICRDLAKAAILQEDYTELIVEAVSTVNPEGVAVIVDGQHGCIRCRGVKSTSPLITSRLTGPFDEQDKVRNEFFKLIEISLLRRR